MDSEFDSQDKTLRFKHNPNMNDDESVRLNPNLNASKDVSTS